MANVTFSKYKDLFETELELLQNPVCATCDVRQDLKHPLLPWLVGSNFLNTKERIVFIGKPHRGLPGEILASGIIDPTSEVEGGLWDIHWPYWSYTREIAENLYGVNAIESIAFTNLIKCSNTDDVDATTPTMARGCISELQVIWREIEVIEARTAVFYTYNLYRELLNDIPFALDGTINEVTPADHIIPCRNKMLHWWDRICETPWTNRFRILVVGHPERMGKPEYVDLITKWIQCGQ